MKVQLSLQSHFANALCHYQMLVHLVNAEITNLVECSRYHLTSSPEGNPLNEHADVGVERTKISHQTAISEFQNPLTQLSPDATFADMASPDQCVLDTSTPMS